MNLLADDSVAEWRSLTRADLPAVNVVAERVHVDYPEDEAVLAERLSLYPAGCLGLWKRDGLAGYLISHPWHFRQPPALNVLLERIPAAASTYYIHDIALLPDARGTGAASVAVKRVVTHAMGTGFPNISLVAVSGSQPFWKRHGFAVVGDPALDQKLRSYDDHAVLMVRTLQDRA